LDNHPGASKQILGKLGADGSGVKVRNIVAYEDRVVMISGGGQGLGFAMAQRFASEGAQVVVCDVNGDAEETVRGIRKEHMTIPVDFSVVDVANSSSVDEWTATTLEKYGRVDVLVNNAGIIRDGRIESMSDDQWDAVFNVNLDGIFYCIRSVFAHMKQQRYGRIVSLSSMSWRGNFGQSNYAAAKAGVAGLARTVALEGAQFGITSNVISPGLIVTPMLASMNERAREKLASRVPLGHIGRPEDIAEAAAYLCSEEAGYVTGVVLDVDGGIGIGSALR
jgi:3-oxoacyl-[acyl-carrier protein] reductase